MRIKFEHDLAICAIMRNEERYLCEWLDWHLLLGVTKFYLYDNGSDDDTRRVLWPYIKAGQVEYRYFPGQARQIPAYNDCLARHRYDCEWLAFIDVDEFLRPLGEEGLLELLRRHRGQQPYMGGLGVHWRIFGANGHEKAPQGGVLDNYLRRAPDEYELHTEWKSIVNPRLARHFVSAHFPAFYHGCGLLDGQGDARIFSPGSQAGCRPLRDICLNHYFTKSREEWLQRRALGKADVNGKVDLSLFDKQAETLAAVYDDGILRLRERLQKEAGARAQEPAQNDRPGLSQALEDMLKDYPKLDAEEWLCLAHGVAEAENPGTQASAWQVLRTLLEPCLRQNGIRMRDWQMLRYELSRLPAVLPGLPEMQAGLEKFYPGMLMQVLQGGRLDYCPDAYMDWLKHRQEPRTAIRAALVTPVLAGKQAEALLAVAAALAGSGGQVYLYAPAPGPLLPKFLKLGVKFIQQPELLTKSLVYLSWYLWFDIIYVNTASLGRLLSEPLDCRDTPVVWWLHEPPGELAEILEQQKPLCKNKLLVLLSPPAEPEECRRLLPGRNVYANIDAGLGADALAPFFRKLTDDVLAADFQDRHAFEELWD